MSYLYSPGHSKYRAQQWCIRQARRRRQNELTELRGREAEVKRVLARAKSLPLQAVSSAIITPKRKGKPWDRVLSPAALAKWCLTEPEAHTILEAQGYACPLCHDEFTKLPHIDHCHVTGRRRGLLCHRCNPGLGMFQDSPEALRRAADYLEAHRDAHA